MNDMFLRFYGNPSGKETKSCINRVSDILKNRKIFNRITYEFYKFAKVNYNKVNSVTFIKKINEYLSTVEWVCHSEVIPNTNKIKIVFDGRDEYLLLTAPCKNHRTCKRNRMYNKIII